ncbi:MAG: TlpA disulfide reductase family protein [Myxococcota bacterium]
MKWLPVALMASLSACVTAKQHQSVENRVASLEAQLTALEDRLAPLLPPSLEEQKASEQLFDDAMTAIQDLRWDDAKGKLGEVLAKYPNTQAAQAAQSMASELAVVGRDALPLEVDQWFQGSEADLTDDKATLYVFWEAWCPHCRREVPRLSETYDRFRDKGLGLVGLTEMTRDVSPEDVATFIEDNDVTYPIAKEKAQALSKQYGIRGIPAAAMVRDGKVVWRGHPATLTDALIERVLMP